MCEVLSSVSNTRGKKISLDLASFLIQIPHLHVSPPPCCAAENTSLLIDTRLTLVSGFVTPFGL